MQLNSTCAELIRSIGRFCSILCWCFHHSYDHVIHLPTIKPMERTMTPFCHLICLPLITQIFLCSLQLKKEQLVICSPQSVKLIPQIFSSELLIYYYIYVKSSILSLLSKHSHFWPIYNPIVITDVQERWVQIAVHDQRNAKWLLHKGSNRTQLLFKGQKWTKIFFIIHWGLDKFFK